MFLVRERERERESVCVCVCAIGVKDLHIRESSDNHLGMRYLVAFLGCVLLKEYV